MRVFVIALYKGSMRRLLLRAEKTDSHPTRVDILFMNTHYIDLPTALEGIEISDVTSTVSGQQRLAAAGVLSSGEIRAYEVTSGAHVGLVLAASMTYVEDEGEYWEPSQFVLDP